jgi:BASS family bile acid:Na+ symporter
MTAEHLVNILAAVTLFELMVTIGLDVAVTDALGVARDWRLLIKAALANYVCFPALAVGLLLFFGAEQAVAAGFLIAAVCPGAPYSPPFTALARGNVTRAVGLMVALAASSAIFAPLLLQVLLPWTGDRGDEQIDAVKMVATLLGAQFVPLCLGLAVRHWRPEFAKRLKRPANGLGLVLNLATLATIVTIQFQMLTEIPARAYGGMTALVLGGIVTGWLLGGPGNANRIAMVMATAVRNAGVSLVIATSAFAGTPAVVAATAFGIFQTILMASIALGWADSWPFGRQAG